MATAKTQLPTGVDQKAFNALRPEEQEAITGLFAVIGQPDCEMGDTDSCKTERENYEAWKKIADISPEIAFGLLARREYTWPIQHPKKPVPNAGPPANSNVPPDLWNRAIAFRWVIKNIEDSKKAEFLERVASQENTYGLRLSHRGASQRRHFQ